MFADRGMGLFKAQAGGRHQTGVHARSDVRKIFGGARRTFPRTLTALAAVVVPIGGTQLLLPQLGRGAPVAGGVMVLNPSCLGCGNNTAGIAVVGGVVAAAAVVPATDGADCFGGFLYVDQWKCTPSVGGFSKHTHGTVCTGSRAV